MSEGRKLGRKDGIFEVDGLSDTVGTCDGNDDCVGAFDDEGKDDWADEIEGYNEGWDDESVRSVVRLSIKDDTGLGVGANLLKWESVGALLRWNSFVSRIGFP